MTEEKVVKLNLKQTNELLKIISDENEEYGLILKLIYIYGRKAGEVLHLKKKDINFEDNYLIFNINNEEHYFPIHVNIKSSLMKAVELINDDDYIFEDYPNIRKSINYFLHRKNTPEIQNLDYMKGINLTTKDFKTLRGQHLYQEGVDIQSIHELYKHKQVGSTKKLINYDKLKHNRKTIKEIIDEYTNLNLYCNYEYSNYNTYYCVNRNKKEAIIENRYGKLEIMGDSEIRTVLNDIDEEHLLYELGLLNQQGDYIYLKGLKIMRN